MPELQGLYMSYDLLTPEKAKQAWDAGYRVFSQQLWTALEQPGNRVVNLRNALNQGFVLVGPIAVNGSQKGAVHVQKARAGIPGDLWDAIALLPIDVELENIPNSYLREAVDLTEAYGKRRSLYYSVHTWVDYQGDPAGFRDCLTYVARYDGIASVAFVQQPPSMIGTFLAGKQYTNTVRTFGMDTCREVWDSRILLPEAIPPVPVTIPVPVVPEPGDPAINFLTKIVINHEERLKKLEGGS